ncbi:MAG: hypothetical protein VKL59_04230 [Nostocaceae cyanobacterium]|nr:hypothetical protein [Nostocaceae cyanobacterium]
MGKLPKFGYLGILALIMTGCGLGGEETATTPSPTATKPAVQQPATTGQQGFPTPLVTPSPAATAPITTAELIKPTDGTERAAVVRKGRTDPFARLPGQQFTTQPAPTAGGAPRPVPTVPPVVTPQPRRTVQQPTGGGRVVTTNPGRPITVAGTRGTPGRPTIITIRPRTTIKPKPSTTVRKITPKPDKSRLAARTNQNKKPNQPRPNASQQAAAPARTLPTVKPNQLPQVIPNPSLAPILPPPPQPDLARAVVVKGVVQTGNNVQAIIKLPDEPTSRTVTAGQRFANGVLLKRIEVNEGSDPVVVLEQYGIEVAKAVGEAPANPAQPGQNTISVTPANQNSSTPRV